MLFFISSLLLSRRGLGDKYNGFGIHLTKKRLLWEYMYLMLWRLHSDFCQLMGLLKNTVFWQGTSKARLTWLMCYMIVCASSKTHWACSSLQAQFASFLGEKLAKFWVCSTQRQVCKLRRLLNFLACLFTPLSTCSCCMSGRLQQKKNLIQNNIGWSWHKDDCRKNDSETQEVVKF